MIQLSEVQTLISKGAVLIDVREPDEYLTNHLDGAINIPLSQIISGTSAYPRDKCMIVYCKSGKRSLVARQTLKSAGYENVFNLDIEL